MPMAVKVLVVDDSSFFRRRVSEILEKDPEIQVIDFAVNGQEAVDKAARLRPDVITMDVEMPVMDGISAVKQIMQSSPTPILMFSSLTREGASATLDALDAGAVDFLPKKFEDIARNSEDAIRSLQNKVKEIGRRRVSRFTRPISSSSTPSPTRSTTTAASSGLRSTAKPIAQPDRSFSRPAADTPSTGASFKASGTKIPNCCNWHLDRWSGCTSNNSDSAASELSASDPADPAYAGGIHPSICTAPE
jgi:two-component system chemotaxis response regulator CheB